MGLYLRKSFKAGPVRLNLSKSGLGVSAGVKGMRIAAGPRGNYVHAGRGGLYYRKSLGSKKRESSSPNLISSILVLIGIITALVFLFKVGNWFIENPVIFYLIAVVVLAVTVYVYFKLSQVARRQRKYKTELDSLFVVNDEAPGKDSVEQLKDLRSMISGHDSLDSKLITVEENVYRAVLDKILDDKFIKENEKNQIAALEKVIQLPNDAIFTIKKELFTSFYMEAISDGKITKDEIESLNSIIDGLNISRNDMRDEIRVIKEIIKAQKLSIPLQSVECKKVKIQKSETPYYAGNGKVLSRKKAKKTSEEEFEYTVLREGELVITGKRVMVVKEGTSTLKLSDVLDIDINVDDQRLVISKNTSSRPFILETNEPFYCAKIIDLLCSEIA